MKSVIISPFSRQLRNKESNPKNYPHWKEVVRLLIKNGVKVIQVGLDSEEDIGADARYSNRPLREITKLIEQADTWASVDNFFHHMCATLGKRGVVLFGKSDPAIFGHGSNVNLLKGREFLRQSQWGLWEDEQHDPNVFVSPDTVCLAIFSLF